MLELVLLGYNISTIEGDIRVSADNFEQLPFTEDDYNVSLINGTKSETVECDIDNNNVNTVAVMDVFNSNNYPGDVLATSFNAPLSHCVDDDGEGVIRVWIDSTNYSDRDSFETMCETVKNDLEAFGFETNTVENALDRNDSEVRNVIAL